MAKKIIKRTLFGAAEEASYGAGAVIGAGAMRLVEDFTHNPSEQITMLERGGMTGSIVPPQSQMIGRLASMNFTAEIKGSGTAGDQPEVGVLLGSCGFETVVQSGVDVTYRTTKDPANFKSVAMDLWDGGADRHQLVGGRGNVALMFEAGTYAKAQFNIWGHPTDPAAETRIDPNYDTPVPVGLKNITMSLGGFSAFEIYSANIEMNNNVAADPVLNNGQQQASGYSEVLITEQNPILTVTLAAQDIADGYDPWADWRSGASKALVLGPIGSTAGNIMTLNAPAAIVQNITNGDQSGKLTHEITYQLAETALGAADNLNIVFT